MNEKLQQFENKMSKPMNIWLQILQQSVPDAQIPISWTRLK